MMKRLLLLTLYLGLLAACAAGDTGASVRRSARPPA